MNFPAYLVEVSSFANVSDTELHDFFWSYNIKNLIMIYVDRHRSKEFNDAKKQVKHISPAADYPHIVGSKGRLLQHFLEEVDMDSLWCPLFLSKKWRVILRGDDGGSVTINPEKPLTDLARFLSTDQIVIDEIVNLNLLHISAWRVDSIVYVGDKYDH